VLLNGCGPITSKSSPDQTTLNQEQEARDLILAGHFAEAAEKYLQLAGQDKRRAVHYRLKAAETYIDGDNFEHGKHILNMLGEKNLSSIQKVHRDILNAWIALSEYKPNSALELLAAELPPESTPELKAKYHEVRALAFEQNKQYLEVMNERVLLGNYLESTEKLSKNYNLLWAIVSQFDVESLNSYRETTPEIIISWLELAIINKTILGNTTNLEAAIDTWSQRYPGHPAQYDIIPNLIAFSKQMSLAPQQVALLLPRNSTLRDASNAIQEGFMAAWYEQEDERPIIKIYDANTQNILDVYQLAVNEGAEFIVGPLEKEAVATLIENNAITVKTMVLNQYEGDQNTGATTGLTYNPSLIQFTLSPEDEARQVAERAWFEGLANTLIITPATTWGERIYGAFQSAWDQLGGKTLKHIRLGLDTQEYSTSIEQILNIDTSKQRSKLLKSKLNRKLHTEPRRRQDADFIFITATPIIGRQLMPQLRFYRAENLSVYSISSIYTGIINTQADTDMNNLIFADMPWIVDPSRNYTSLQTALNDFRNQSNSNYKRLYAFGIDAYRLIPQLGKLANNPSLSYEGETGLIKLDPAGKLQRQLTWVKFVDGEPRLIDSVKVY
jgi:outer membrane PBP1 activator LpoA protein